MNTTVAGPVGESFVVYSHIGVSSTSDEPGRAEGLLSLRDDLRGAEGVLVAPLLVMLLDSVATATLPLASAVPSHVAVEVFEPATDIAELRIRGQVRRSGRTQIYYDARIEDAADATRVVGYGSVNMAVTGPAVAEYEGHRNRPASPADGEPRPPLTEMFEGRPIGGGRYEIAELSARTGFGRIHAGVMTVMAEAAATDLVRSVSGASRLRTEQLDAQLLAGGRRGPFDVVPELLSIDKSHATCRVEVLDRGAESRLISVILGRIRIEDQ